MKNLLGITLGALLVAGGGWIRWCPSPVLEEWLASEAVIEMMGEVAILLLALGTFLIGSAINRCLTSDDS